MTFSTLLNEHASQIMQMTTLSLLHIQIFKFKIEAAKAIWWFSNNLMQANPEKFQLLFFNCKVESPVILDGCIIKPEKVVKLLGITIDEN